MLGCFVLKVRERLNRCRLSSNARFDIRLRIERRDKALHFAFALVARGVKERLLVVRPQECGQQRDCRESHVTGRETPEDVWEVPRRTGGSDPAVRRRL